MSETKLTSNKSTTKTGNKAKAKPSPRLTDIKPAKKPISSKSTTKIKSNQHQKPTTNRPNAKKSAKSIDSFSIPVDRSKTTAGNTDMDFDDLEKRVEKYDASENITEDKPKKTEKAAKPKTTKLDSKPRQIFRVIGAILSLLLLISSAILGAMVVAINFLPSIYLLLALAVLGIIAIGFSVVMVHRKVKPAIKMPFFFLSILFSAIYVFGINYLNKTFDFFDNLKDQDSLTESYYVVVEKDSEYKDIHDLRGKTIATYNENLEIYQEALKKLQALVKVELKDVDSIGALSSSLTDHSADGVLISAVHKEMLDDLTSDETTHFSENTRIIYTIEVRVDAKTSISENKIDIATEPFTVYISGIDAYGDISNMQRGRSDVNMLATVNPTTHEVLLTSIPRDYYVQLHGTTGNRDKLTHAGIYGVQMSVETLEDLLDIDINYYLKVNFSTVESLVDTIGGIEVYSDQQFKPLHGDRIVQKGINHFDGKMALAFARERYAYSTGDRHRVQNQQDVIAAIIKKISGSTVILTKYAEILDNLSSSITTNIGKDEISSLVKMQLQDMPSWQIGQYSLNGSDSHNFTYSMGQQLLYVMEPNPETIKTAHDNIMMVIEGKPLSDLTLTEK